MNVEGRGKVVPFVRMFYGSPSSFLWEDASGVTHTIPQGEGGARRFTNASPFLLGQHSALAAIQEDLHDNEFLFALLDDIYIATTPHRAGDVYKSLDEHLWAYSRIRIHGGKTHVWHAVDDRPEFCDVLEQIAQRSDPPCPGVARFCAPSRQTRRQSLWDTIGPSTVCGGVSVQENCSSGGVAGTHSCSP